MRPILIGLKSSNREILLLVYQLPSALPLRIFRIHQSGHLAELTPDRCTLVKEALNVYKTIRGDIKNSVPIWPIGLSQFHDEWTCLGLHAENRIYLAVWRRDGDKHTLEIPLDQLNGKEVAARCLYPSFSEVSFAWDASENVLTVTMDRDFMARLFYIEAN